MTAKARKPLSKGKSLKATKTPPKAPELRAIRNRPKNSVPTQRELEIALWLLEKEEGNKSSAATKMGLAGTTFRGWLKFANEGYTRERVEASNLWTKDTLLAKYKGISKSFGDIEVPHPQWVLLSNAGNSFYRYWPTWNAFRAEAHGRPIAKGRKPNAVSSMKPDEAARLLKIYEAQGCNGKATAVILNESYDQVMNKIYVAKAQMSWTPPPKHMPKEDDGINRTLSDRLFAEIKAQLKRLHLGTFRSAHVKSRSLSLFSL